MSDLRMRGSDVSVTRTVLSSGPPWWRARGLVRKGSISTVVPDRHSRGVRAENWGTGLSSEALLLHVSSTEIRDLNERFFRMIFRGGFIGLSEAERRGNKPGLCPPHFLSPGISQPSILAGARPRVTGARHSECVGVGGAVGGPLALESLRPPVWENDTKRGRMFPARGESA